MHVLNLERDGLETCVEKASETLKSEGVILYPTDTLYGLGGDAFSNEVIEKVCRIKERDERRPLHAVFADMEMVEKYTNVLSIGRALAEEFFPGPLTLIFEKKASVKSGIARRLPTIGVRIPKHEFCLELAKRFGAPYTTTSANRSGEEPRTTVEEILEQFGKETAIDLVIDGGRLPAGYESTIVDVRDEPFILREGAIPADEIWNVIAR